MIFKEFQHTVDSTVTRLSVGIKNCVNVRQCLTLIWLMVEKLGFNTVFSESFFCLESLR